MPERPTLLDPGAFQRPLSPLFRDYLRGAPGIAPFFEPGGFSEEALSAALGRALARPLDREPLARALERQQQERGASPLPARRLAQKNATAIVTGQQPVLFGGPLFVLYKALGAIALARRLEARHGSPVVPVFWVASDDHDFAEVRSVSVLGAAGQLQTLRYQPQYEPTGQPTSKIALDSSIEALLGELEQVLPESLHRSEVLSRLKECYRPGRTIASAFASFISGLSSELVVLDPSDPEVKSLMRPVLARELKETSPTSRLAAEVGVQLLASGYHQQVPVRNGFLNLFLVSEGERRALGIGDSTVEVRGTSKRIPLEEALRSLEADASNWSPGVLLRPLAEDFMLPTVAYVGGPAEIAYHAQIGPSYAHFGIPRPAIVPRPSLTLVEPAQARALESEELGILDLEGELEALLSLRVREAHPGVEAALKALREAVDKGMHEVEDVLEKSDPTLKGAADAAHGRLLHQIETLREKTTRALKKRDQSRGERLRRTRDALFPGGAFQERGLGLIGVLGHKGMGFVEELLARIDPLARGHQVLYT